MIGFQISWIKLRTTDESSQVRLAQIGSRRSEVEKKESEGGKGDDRKEGLNVEEQCEIEVVT